MVSGGNQSVADSRAQTVFIALYYLAAIYKLEL